MKKQFPGEQLAYIAALAVDAPLVFGDRPKAITYRRLLARSPIALDEAFGRICAQNYAEMVPQWPHSEGPFDDCFWSILTEERNMVLAASLQRAAAEAGPGAVVAGVVGGHC